MTYDELRAVPIFADLTDEQLAWVGDVAEEVRLEPGEFLFHEGDDDVAFHVFLEGLVRATKRIGSEDVVLTTHLGGAFSGEVPLLNGTAYVSSIRALEPTRVLRFAPEAFHRLVKMSPTFTATVLRAVAQRTQMVSELSSHQQKLAALGKIAAGLAHELNNPAAAIRRAADQLRQADAAGRAALRGLAEHDVSPATLATLAGLQPVVDPATAADPLALSDLEEQIAFWLKAQDVEDAWELAPSLAGAGFDEQRLASIIETLPAPARSAGLHWLVASLTKLSLASEIEASATRISDLVASVKSRSYVDKKPQQAVNIHEGLEKTLKMLEPKLARIVVVRDYDQSLPRVLTYGDQMNQVWTNLIDNAIDAMNGAGRLTVRTVREPDRALVEIGDTGPGIPAELQNRLGEPFFTTKPLGQGTGLGLDIVYRIVVGRHGGDLRVESVPGNTRFQVRLPLAPSPRDGARPAGPAAVPDLTGGK